VDTRTAEVILNGTKAEIVSVSESTIVAALNVSAAGVHYILVRVGGQLSTTLYKNTTRPVAAPEPRGARQ
jgi:hypothetical protein